MGGTITIPIPMISITIGIMEGIVVIVFCSLVIVKSKCSVNLTVKDLCYLLVSSLHMSVLKYHSTKKNICDKSGSKESDKSITTDFFGKRINEAFFSLLQTIAISPCLLA